MGDATLAVSAVVLGASMFQKRSTDAAPKDGGLTGAGNMPSYAAYRGGPCIKPTRQLQGAVAASLSNGTAVHVAFRAVHVRQGRCPPCSRARYSPHCTRCCGAYNSLVSAAPGLQSERSLLTPDPNPKPDPKSSENANPGPCPCFDQASWRGGRRGGAAGRRPCCRRTRSIDACSAPWRCRASSRCLPRALPSWPVHAWGCDAG